MSRFLFAVCCGVTAASLAAAVVRRDSPDVFWYLICAAVALWAAVQWNHCIIEDERKARRDRDREEG